MSKTWLLISSLLITYGSSLAFSDASDPAAGRYHAGLAYERLGRMDEAYTELQLACALDADDARKALALGILALRLGHEEVALRSLEHSITLDANSVASYYQLALLYEKQHVDKRAVDSWNRFLALNQEEGLRRVARKHIQALDATSKKLERLPHSLRIAVQRFDEDDSAEVTNEFARALKAIGPEGSDESQGVHAVFSGTVTEYSSERKGIVVLGTVNTLVSSSSTVRVSNPIVALEAEQNALLNPAMASHEPKIVTTGASAGAAARLVEVPSGTVLWSGDYSYEGLDLPTAKQAMVRIMVQALQRAAPRFPQRAVPGKKG